jgi:hypothetical protein
MVLLINLITIMYNAYISDSKLGQLFSIIFGAIFLIEQKGAENMIDMFVNHHFQHLIYLVLSLLIGGGISWIGGVLTKKIWNIIVENWNK